VCEPNGNNFGASKTQVNTQIQLSSLAAQVAMALVNVTFLKAYDLAQACPSPGYIDHVHHPQLIFDGKNPDLWQSSMLRRFIRTVC